MAERWDLKEREESQGWRLQGLWPTRLGSDCGKADFGGRNLRSVGRFEHGAAIPLS